MAFSRFPEGPPIYRGRGRVKPYPIGPKFFLEVLYTWEHHWFKEQLDRRKSPKNETPYSQVCVKRVLPAQGGVKVM